MVKRPTKGSSQTSPPAQDKPQGSLAQFWQRVTEGLELHELWRQFEAEARAGYDHYSAEVDWEVVRRQSGWKRPFLAAKELAWAMLMKLTPARRILLLVALVLMIAGRAQVTYGEVEVSSDFAVFGVLLLLFLLALELADRVTMKRDLEIAREIQRWLVPEAPPKVPGLDIAFATRPANTVAGDYYDAFPLGHDSKRLLFVVADVAGKSVPAALLMATFQACLHSCAHSCKSLEDLVSSLNEFACSRSLNGQRFTTAFLAECDVTTRTLTYVSAGHNSPVLRRVSGTCERLEEGGVPLGIERGARYDFGSTRMERGDLLLIFTDGLIETVNGTGQEYGEDRMIYMLNTVPGESASETIRFLIQDADLFAAGVRQHDDITCLVVRAV